MKPEQQALFNEILAHPSRDDLRLVYADWLEEFGTTEAETAQAEFIRLEVEVASSGWPESVSIEANRKRDRATLLWNRHASAWLPPESFFRAVEGQLHGYKAAPLFESSQSRGWPNGAGLTAAAYRAQASTLLATVPLEELDLRVDDDGESLSNVPWPPGLKILELEVPSVDVRWDRVINNLPLHTIEELTIESPSHPMHDFDGGEALDRLLLGPIASRLKQLKLEGSFSDEALRRVFDSDRFPSLCEITVDSPHGLEIVASTGFASRVVRLSGSDQNDGDGWEAIAKVGAPRLESLSPLGGGWGRLVGSNSVPCLRELMLVENRDLMRRRWDPELRELAASNFRRIEILRTRSFDSLKPLDILAGGETHPRLHLDIQRMRPELNPRHLFTPLLNKVERLSLHEVTIQFEIAKDLSLFPTMRHLSLVNQAQQVNAVAELECFNAVEWLEIVNEDPDPDRPWEALVCGKGLRNLRTLIPLGNPPSPQWRRKLEQRFEFVADSRARTMPYAKR